MQPMTAAELSYSPIAYVPATFWPTESLRSVTSPVLSPADVANDCDSLLNGACRKNAWAEARVPEPGRREQMLTWLDGVPPPLVNSGAQLLRPRP